jgi:hypothetical protein
MKTLLPVRALVLLGAAAAFSACAGNDPLSLLPTGTPQLALPVAEGIISTAPTYSYNSSVSNGPLSEGFGFEAGTVLSAGQSILSPAEGVVTKVDSGFEPGYVAVTIYHGPRLTTRLSHLAVSVVNAGAFVHVGDIVGTSASSNTFPARLTLLTVFFDGAKVCPYSYFTPTARRFMNQHGFLNNGGGTSIPCFE